MTLSYGDWIHEQSAAQERWLRDCLRRCGEKDAADALRSGRYALLAAPVPGRPGLTRYRLAHVNHDGDYLTLPLPDFTWGAQ